jgi:hypothetical protein
MASDETYLTDHAFRLIMEGKVPEEIESPILGRKLDINAIILPTTSSPIKFMCPRCLYCKCMASECFLNLFNGEYSTACDDVTMEISSAVSGGSSEQYLQKYARYKLYGIMGTLCLMPFGLGHRKELPHCVVKDIHKTFPDPSGGILRESEATIMCYRRMQEPHSLIIERKPPDVYECHPF